jgi:hypothetical protein
VILNNTRIMGLSTIIGITFIIIAYLIFFGGISIVSIVLGFHSLQLTSNYAQSNYTQSNYIQESILPMWSIVSGFVILGLCVILPLTLLLVFSLYLGVGFIQWVFPPGIEKRLR